ncbi:MAG: T9SS type A sorting domain-containing protein [Bacteroidia bacterium]
MKKIIYSLSIAAALGCSVLTNNCMAQVPTCSIDPVFVASGAHGIWPDSTVNFVSGTVGQPYTQNATIVIPLDTVTSVLTCTYTSIDLQPTTNNYNLPPGLSLTGTPSNFVFPGNANSCMEIYGTPTTVGTYSLTFVLKVYCAIYGAVTTYTVSYYHIKINAAAGIESNPNSYNFQVMQNNPNPVVGSNTAVKFTTPTDGKAKMSVYNVTGQKIAEKEFSAQRGDNSYDFDATTLENGIYLYSIEYNGQKQVRRMVVAK